MPNLEAASAWVIPTFIWGGVSGSQLEQSSHLCVSASIDCAASTIFPREDEARQLFSNS